MGNTDLIRDGQQKQQAQATRQLIVDCEGDFLNKANSELVVPQQNEVRETPADGG